MLVILWYNMSAFCKLKCSKWLQGKFPLWSLKSELNKWKILTFNRGYFASMKFVNRLCCMGVMFFFLLTLLSDNGMTDSSSKCSVALYEVVLMFWILGWNCPAVRLCSKLLFTTKPCGMQLPFSVTSCLPLLFTNILQSHGLLMTQSPGLPPSWSGWLAGYKVLAALTIACWRRLGPRRASKIKTGPPCLWEGISEELALGTGTCLYIHSPRCGSG